MDARVMLADPDALNPQGLASRLSGLGIQPEATAQEPAAVLGLVVDAQHELMTRKGQGAHADTRPSEVVVDELPECLRVLSRHDSGRLQSALELIGGLSGRKHSVSVIMLGQSWSKAVVGSTAMRNLITSSAVFRMRSDEAKSMINLRAEYWRAAGPDPLDLEPGMFYAVGIDSGAVLARVPELPLATRTPARDFHSSSDLASGLASTGFRPDFRQALVEANGKSDGSLMEANADTDEVEPTAEDWRIAELFDQGLDIAEIVQQVFNVTSAGGRRYQQKNRDVQAALRRVRQAT